MHQVDKPARDTRRIVASHKFTVTLIVPRAPDCEIRCHHLLFRNAKSFSSQKLTDFFSLLYIILALQATRLYIERCPRYNIPDLRKQ